MAGQNTLFDKFLSRIKNNRIVTVLLVIGTIVSPAATFTDPTSKLWIFMTQRGTPSVAGRWQTPALVNPYDNSERSVLILQLAQKDDALLGTVTESDIDGSNPITWSITHGKISGNVVSFYIESEVTESTDAYQWSTKEGIRHDRRSGEETRSYKEFYFGTLNNKRNEMAFRRVNDVPEGRVEEAFIAKRN
jgi:hypothetical protein